MAKMANLVGMRSRLIVKINRVMSVQIWWLPMAAMVEMAVTEAMAAMADQLAFIRLIPPNYGRLWSIRQEERGDKWEQAARQARAVIVLNPTGR